ncbi:MAG: hypothetical protein U9N35_03410 [Euryarchaeota archaeon]|nr:hypothetical protein [Euryarchaeota archaeon]
MIDMEKLSNINRETKLFFLSLFFISLIGAVFIEKDHIFVPPFLGLAIGASVGFVSLYVTGRLGIYKSDKKYDTFFLKDHPFLSKKLKRSIRVYYLTWVSLFFIGCGMGLLDWYPGSTFIVCTAGGAIMTYSFFIAAGRLNIYKKEEYSDSKKDNGALP